MTLLNLLVRKYMKPIELVAVVMRISSFSLVSWLGSHSPFLLVWVVNTIDAVGLSWCAILRKDLAYTVLNVFWMIIGAVGILRAVGAF
jgi:hypothetical protein